MTLEKIADNLIKIIEKIRQDTALKCYLEGDSDDKGNSINPREKDEFEARL